MAEIDIRELNISARLEPRSMIAKAEEKYRTELTSLGDRLASDASLRLVMLAGPSGAGKTTTANILADMLKARGRKASVVSLDHFYREASDPLFPKTPDGANDCECVDSLDTERISACLGALVAGGKQIIYKYDFATGKPGSDAITLEPGKDGIIIVEGLHALNPRMLIGIPQKRVCRVFVSVSTNINDGDERIFSGRRMRFLRRLVRDNLYRGSSAEKTLAMWRDVLAGEDKYLYPYKAMADYAFDTFHSFELGVLKPFCDKLLTGDVLRDEYARRVRPAIDLAEAIPLELVPTDSLVREFIPGGKYEELY